MFYQKILPIKPLQNHIRYFWVLEGTADKTFKIIPDGLSGLIVQEEPDLFLNKEYKLLPQMFLYGQTTCPGEQQAVGNFRIFGAYLQPTALKAIFKIDALELTNQHIALDCLTKEPILEQIIHASSITEKIEIISLFFLKRIQQVEQSLKRADFATILLQQGKALKDIQSEMKISERSLERLIKQYVGISPKAYSRIVRFQSGLEAFRKNNFKTLTDVAYQNDYFDQSHFIREFKAFTGMNPKQYLHQTIEQVENYPEWIV